MLNRNDQIKALSDPIRIEILRNLIEPRCNFPTQLQPDPIQEGVTIANLAKRFNQKKFTMARHVMLLHRAGFVCIDRSAPCACCKIVPSMANKYCMWLMDQLSGK